MAIKVKLKKAFNHDGHPYKEGDTYEGEQSEIDALVRQGYADDPAKEKEKEEVAAPAASSGDTGAAPARHAAPKK